MLIELFAPVETVPLGSIEPGKCFRRTGDSANNISMVTGERSPNYPRNRVYVSLMTGTTYEMGDDESVIAVAAKVVPL